MATYFREPSKVPEAVTEEIRSTVSTIISDIERRGYRCRPELRTSRRLEAGRYGIRVNLIPPGFVAGPRLDWVIDAQAEGRRVDADVVRREMQGRTALKQLTAPRDIARVAVFLASDESRAITGADIDVNSGVVMYQGETMPRLIDLSQDIYQGMKVYPGHLKTVVFQHATHEETAPRFDSGFSFQTLGFMLNDNGPTHVDSFSHLDPDPEAETIDQMSLDLFYGPAISIDVSSVAPKTDITADHLDEALAGSGLDLDPGDMLFLYTATFDRHHGTDAYLSEFPGLGETGAEWIVDRGVKTFGVDSPTPDNPMSTSYPVHMMCRREHITHYENLRLTEVVGSRFTFVGFPLKVVGAHGGPTRAVAILP